MTTLYCSLHSPSVQSSPIWTSDDPLSTWQVYDAPERNFYDGVQRYLSFHRSNSKTIPYEDNNGRQIMDVLNKSELASLLPDAILHACVRFTSSSQYKLRITGSHSVQPQLRLASSQPLGKLRRRSLRSVFAHSQYQLLLNATIIWYCSLLLGLGVIFYLQ